MIQRMLCPIHIHDGNRRGFAACARGGGDRQMGEGTRLPYVVQHSLCIRRKQQRLDALGGIHGTAAAQRDQAVAVLSEIQIMPGGTVLKVRVGMIAGKYGVRNRAEAVV